MNESTDILKSRLNNSADAIITIINNLSKVQTSAT